GEQSAPVRVRRRFKALSKDRRSAAAAIAEFQSGLSWQVCENFCAAEVDAVRIHLDPQASEAWPPASRCAAITDYLDFRWRGFCRGEP
ncbi:hypothetical protein, partial [Rhizobium leguminosarum]|uniref:hypothetical protein n=1 Tax=Rhizobium leguminosarum TaxID=384 RepID=UPI003F9CF8C1